MNLKPEFREQYLIYNRKSTDDAENQRNTLAYQLSRALPYAELNKLPIAKGLTTAGFCKAGVIDEAHSAFKEEDEFAVNDDGSIQYRILRPKFLNLVRLLKAGSVKGVIFLCWDRASRNKHDDLVLKRLMRQGADVRFVEVNYQKGSAGDLHMDIDALFSSYYSATVSEKIKGAYSKLRNEGFCTYRSPIGYLDEGTENKPFDPQRAPTVKRIFELYATGEWGLHQLAKWSQQQGLTKKPTRRKRTKEEILNNVELDTLPIVARPADHKTIEYILTNQFYIGKIRVPGGWRDSISHRPLISTKLFQEVQTQLRRRRVSVHYVDKPFFSYRGTVRCVCGRLYAPYVQKGKTYYGAKCQVGCSNKRKSLSEKKVDDFVYDVLLRLPFTAEELAEVQRERSRVLPYLKKELANRQSDLEARQRNIIGDIAYLSENRITLMRTGSMKAEAIAAELARLEGVLYAVTIELEQYAVTPEEAVECLCRFSNQIRDMRKYFPHAVDSEKRKAVQTMFSELVISDGNVIEYRGKDGFGVFFDRNWVTGAAVTLFSELYKNYPLVKRSIEALSEISRTAPGAVGEL